ncbi:MAG: riboflavin biosynthesis protein RibF [Bacteroidota bacterium]
MKVYRSLETYQKGNNPVATIGTFDGVHLGHSSILHSLIDSAKEVQGETVLISFYPHPRLVLFPNDDSLKMLQTLEEKIATLEAIGLDKLLLIPFTREFSRTSSRAFIRDILVGVVGIKKIVIGYDHHFGRNRTGGLEELQSYANRYNYEVQEIPAKAIDDANISSTKIRNALKNGELESANLYLGYPYEVSGVVIHGQKLGRTLGYPTANIKVGYEQKLIPAKGLYLVRVHHEGGPHFGLLNLGNKPVAGKFPLGLEVFLLDFEGDLYDQPLRVQFLKYLRPEKDLGEFPKAERLDRLVEIMKQDEANARDLIPRFTLEA